MGGFHPVLGQKITFLSLVFIAHKIRVKENISCSLEVFERGKHFFRMGHSALSDW